jgi:hypothetical protein
MLALLSERTEPNGREGRRTVRVLVTKLLHRI